MRRDPQIQTILSTDSQNTAIDKINSNFLGIYFLSGGSLGGRGLTGPTGAFGLPGNPGNDGNNGLRGNRWFIGDFEPSGGPGDVITNGDYWIDSSTGSNMINEFTTNGWVNTSYNIAPISEFIRLEGIAGQGGNSGANAIFYKKNPETSSFSFSDVTLFESNANPLHSMFMVSSDPEATEISNMIEFSRGDLADGTASDYLKHPTISFVNAEDDNSDLSFLVPQDKLNINTLSTSVDVPYELRFYVGGAVNVRSSTGVTIESGIFSLNGMYMLSPGSMTVNTDGAFRPDFLNFEYDNNASRINRIKLNTSLVLNSTNTNIPAIKIASKVDTNSTGTGNLMVELTGGSFSEAANEYRPDNYAMKIGTVDPLDVLTNRFSINAAGSIYRQKESSSVVIISESSANISYDGLIYRSWYNLGNVDTHVGNVPTGNQTAFAADTNEILIDPNIASNYTLAVGLQFNTNGIVSYLNNLKHIGETLKLRVRSINPSVKIGSVGITYVSASTATANIRYPVAQLHKFDTPSSVVDFTIVKQVAGYDNTGDYVYFDGNGESGFWITTN